MSLSGTIRAQHFDYRTYSKNSGSQIVGSSPVLNQVDGYGASCQGCDERLKPCSSWPEGVSIGSAPHRCSRLARSWSVAHFLFVGGKSWVSCPWEWHLPSFGPIWSDLCSKTYCQSVQCSRYNLLVTLLVGSIASMTKSPYAAMHAVYNTIS